MKKSKIITLLSTLVFAITGLAAVQINDVNNEIEDVSAISSGDKVYLNPGCWNSSGAWYAAYFFDGTLDATWKGLVSDGAYYSTTIPDGGYTSVIFTRMDPSKHDLAWESKWNQTGNLSLNDGNLFSISDWSSGSWSTIKDTGRYVVGVGGDWTIENATHMTHSSEYSASVTLAYGDEIKLVYYNGSAIQWNKDTDTYEKLTPNADAYVYFGKGAGDDSNGHNIKCYAAGTYTFYFTDSNYDSIYKSSVSYSGALTAQHLAAKIMGADVSTGTCADDGKFPAMRAVFLGLSTEEQTTFKGYASSSESQFVNAYNRYTAWAKALGEDPWSNSKAPNAIYGSNLFGSANAKNSTWIIVVISLVGVSTIGCYFFYKKRKENY